MSTFGLDYGGYIAPATLKSLGATFVCRYLREVGAQEIHDLHAAGINVVLIHEYSGTTPRGGFNYGVADARLAKSQADALGCPDHVVIWFTADFDATPQEQSAINAYLDGCSSVVGFNRVGLYGGYWPLSRAFAAGKLKWGWQTYSWSGGNFDSRCQLFQYSNNHKLAGVNVDYDRAFPVDYGQWAPGALATKGGAMLAEAVNADGRRERFTALASGQIKHIWEVRSADGSLHWNGKAGVTPYYWEDLGNVGGTPVGISVGRDARNCLSVCVKLADGSAKECWQLTPGGAWHGSQPGRTALWEGFDYPGA
jgi:hypothetical protein